MALRRLINSITSASGSYETVKASNNGSDDAANKGAPKKVPDANFKAFQAKTARDTTGYKNLEKTKEDVASTSQPPVTSQAPAKPSAHPAPNTSTYRRLS